MWSRAPAVPFKVMTIARIVYAAAVADKACHLEYELRQLVRQCVENHFNTPRQADREHARGCLPLGYAPSIRRPVRHVVERGPVALCAVRLSVRKATSFSRAHLL